VCMSVASGVVAAESFFAREMVWQRKDKIEERSLATLIAPKAVCKVLGGG